MACLWRVVVVRGVTLRGTSVLGLPLARDRNVASVTFWGWVPCRAKGLSGPCAVDRWGVVKLMTLSKLEQYKAFGWIVIASAFICYACRGWRPMKRL